MEEISNLCLVENVNTKEDALNQLKHRHLCPFLGTCPPSIGDMVLMDITTARDAGVHYCVNCIDKYFGE